MPRFLMLLFAASLAACGARPAPVLPAGTGSSPVAVPAQAGSRVPSGPRVARPAPAGELTRDGAGAGIEVGAEVPSRAARGPLLAEPPVTGAAPPPPPVTLGGIAFHSLQWQVKLPALPAGVAATTLQRQLQAVLDSLDDSLTTYRPDSELMRFNATTVGEWMPLSPVLREALQGAAAVSALSGGAYDVTVGPLVELWGFGAAPAPAVRPSAAAIAAARAQVGWRRLEVDPATGRGRRLADVRADLSSLGEGAGADALAQVLEAAGVRDYLVRVAGTSRQRGQRPGGGAWALAIERPDASGLPGRRLRAAEAVVSTSGAYRNVRVIGGEPYSHTLDPRTGAPVSHAGVSVTVVFPAAQGALRADALATALSVLGPEQGLALAAREGLAVLFLERVGEGWQERWSPAFGPFLAE